MWVIVQQTNEGKKFTLLVGKEYVIGRKDADILVPSDPSISRRHAVFTVLFSETNISKPYQQPTLKLKDVSKFGTIVQDVTLKNAETEVKHEDIITFGTTGNSKYQALYQPYILTTSCIASPFKKSVKGTVTKLGGHVINEWRKECQLLVMSNINVTIKVICALVSLKPIVTPQYLDDLVKAIENQTTLPDPDSYRPPLAESQLDPECVTFSPLIDRQTLFQGKIFIFLSPKQFNKLSMAVELAGGTPMLMEEGTDDNEDDILVGPGSCVISCDQSDASQMSRNAQKWLNHVLKLLKKHKKRPITEPEIGYAVLYCSTEENCNPDKELALPGVSKSDIVPQSVSQVQPQSEQPEILAENTEFDPTVHKRPKNVARGDVTHIDETKLEIVVKEEPVSQPMTQTQKKKTATKRNREEETEQNEPEAEPSRKKLTLSRAVKQEIVTPQKPQRSPKKDADHPSPSKVARSKDFATSARVTRSRSPAPSPEPEKRATRSRKSPSPVSESISPRKKAKEPKDEVCDIVEDFDTIPDRKSRKRNNNIKTEEIKEKTASRETVVDGFDSDCEMDSIMADIETSVDDFDEVPSRKSRKKDDRKAATSNTGEVHTNEADVQNVAVKKETEATEPLVYSRKNETGKAKGAVTSSKDTNAKQTLNTDITTGSLAYCRSNKTGKNKVAGGTSQGGIVKDEPEDNRRAALVYDRREAKHADRNLCNSNIETANSRESDTVDMGEFLSSRRPNQGQHVNISEFSSKDEGLPSNCVNVQEQSLVARKSGTVRETAFNENSAKWKGVKNFKKFKKAQTFDGLPKIIGGSDLVVHDNKPREELEEWFREELQVESQQNEIDRMAMEMFDYEPPVRKRRH